VGGGGGGGGLGGGGVGGGGVGGGGGGGNAKESSGETRVVRPERYWNERSTVSGGGRKSFMDARHQKQKKKKKNKKNTKRKKTQGATPRQGEELKGKE